MKKMTLFLSALFITVATGLGSNGHADTLENLNKPNPSVTIPAGCQECELDKDIMTCKCEHSEYVKNMWGQGHTDKKLLSTSIKAHCINGYKNNNGTLACN